jgi:hypothetical protein
LKASGTRLSSAKAVAVTKDYLSSFATVLAGFSAPRTQEEVLAQIPQLLSAEFDATRSEL